MQSPNVLYTNGIVTITSTGRKIDVSTNLDNQTLSQSSFSMDLLKNIFYCSKIQKDLTVISGKNIYSIKEDKDKLFAITTNETLEIDINKNELHLETVYDLLVNTKVNINV